MTRSFDVRILASILLIGLISLLTLNPVAYGQAISGDLTGSVLDPSGAVVNGATVEATNTATGQTVTTNTKGRGEYRFGQLPVGVYTVTVRAQGFKSTTLANTPVELNKTNTANVRLEVGASSTTVEVSAGAASVDTTSAQLESLYDSRLAEDVGITSAGGAAGGVLNLSLLSPGVTNSSAMGLGAGPSVGGQRPRDNNFTIEGVDNNNKAVTGNLAAVPNDAVQSFSLLENQFNAEFGHSSGGQFNTTIKSGTNSFHGSVYEYFRNRNLNAVDNYYSLQQLTSNPRFDSNRYGGTFGGPILKNRLFFFTDFERQGIGSTGTGGGAVSTPTAAGLAAITGDPNVNANNLAVFQQYVPVAAAGTGCIQYNGQLPAADGGGGFPGQSSPYSAPANGICPAGQVEVGAVSITAPAWQNWENYVQSVDFNASGKDQIRGRYIMNREDLIDTAPNLPAFYLVEPQRWHVFTLGEYHTFSPNLVNEFRFGFNRFSQVVPTGNFQFAGLDSFPNLQFNDLGAGLQVGPDPNGPQFTIQNLYQIVDNVSWTKGAHTLKFGGEYRWYISPQSFTQRQRGDYEYNGMQVYLEDFAPDYFGERSSGAVTYYGNLKGIYWYANDVWKANRHLTLNLGVRYEYNGTPTGENLQPLNKISDDPNLIVPGVNQPLTFNKPEAPKNGFAPRLGFAYSPGSNGTTSIRGGFGMAYDVLYDNIGILAVPPQVGATFDVASVTPAFLGGGGLPGGGSGTQVLDQATARSLTSSWIPNRVQYPYSINWNFGIQHSFGHAYTAEIRYVGTRGVHLDAQTRINRRARVDANNFLPTYLQAPSQTELDALTTTLTTLTSNSNFVPAFENDGFGSSITCDCPFGSSVYHGLESQLTRRFSNGLQFQAAYTFSRTIDNDTADFFTTYLTPRRPQDFQNFAAERSVSPLSRTHRFTIAAVYDLPFFKNDNWFAKNIVGNWSFSPVYTYESPEWANAQSANDANLNGDGAGDRAVINPAGNRDIGSAVTPLTNTSGDTVAYLASNPSAYYIQAGAGALANGGRNTFATAPTNNWDLGVYKIIGITERVQFRFGAQFANIFNHAQYIPGSNPGAGYGVNDVESFTTATNSYLSYVNVADPNFNKPKSVFASNARTIGLVAKITF